LARRADGCPLMGVSGGTPRAFRVALWADFLKHHSMGRGIDDLPDRRVVLEAQASPPVTEKQHGLSLPPKQLIKDTIEAASALKFFIDPAVIGFRVFSEVRLSADEINGDIQVTNAVGVADVATKRHCFVDTRQKAAIAVQGLDPIE